MTFKYFNVKNGLTTGNITLNASNGNAVATTFIGNVSVTSLANLGVIGNVRITGGSSGQVLTTDGTGNLSFTTVSGGGGSSISNGNSNVSIPTANGNINLSASGNANIAIITGTGVNVAGTLNATGNANVGNLGATGVVATTLGGSLTTASQPNITSVGTLTSLSITGNASAGNANLGNLATANFFSGSGNLLSNIQGANVTGAVSSATTAGTVTTNAQPNITSVGTLTDLNVNGNAVIGGNLTVNGDLTYVNVTNLSVEDPIIQLQTGPNAAAPTSNSGKDVGTALNYYDSAARIAFMGWDVSNAEFGFGNTVSISSEVVTFTSYGNVRAGFFIGNGSQLTGVTATTAVTVTANAQPNITSLGTLGNLTSNGTINFTNASNVSLGAVDNVKITGGSANFVLSTDGSGNLSWVAQSGGGGTPNAIANGNSNVSIPSSNGNINLSAAGNANILVVTGTGANVNGTLYANGVITGNSNLDVGTNFLLGNGYYISGIAQATSAAAVANGTSNVNIPLVDGNIEMSVNGNAAVLVVTGTGANVIGTLNVTGNTTLANVTTGGGSGGNISGANVISSNTFTASGNVSASNANLGNLVTANFFAGTLTTAAQPNITSLGTLTSLSVSGNLSAGNLIGRLANGNSNVSIPSANGNVNISAAGNANVLVITGTGANVNGTLYADGIITGNANIDVGTNFLLGNGYYISGIAQATSAAAVSNGTSNVNIPLVDGNIELSAAGNAAVLVVTGTGANIVGTLNVTGNTVLSNVTTGGGSGGNISGANVISSNTFTASGNVSASNISANGIVNFTSTSNVSLGAVGNVKITGGSANFVLSTDGSGNLSWVAQSGGGGGSTPGGANTQIQFNDAGTLNGNANLTFNKLTSVLTITGNVAATNANLGNLATANFFTGTLTTASQPNITSVSTSFGNLTFAINSQITMSGTAASVSGANLLSASFLTGTLTSGNQPNITSVGTLSSLTVGPNSSITLSGTTGFLRANSIQGRDGTTGLITYYSNISGAIGVVTDLTVGTSGTGNLTVNGSANITGNLDVSTSSNTNLGNVANIHISGGTANYFLQTDGSGNLTWAAASGSGSGAIGIANVSDNSSYFPVFANITTGNLTNVYINSSTLTFNPSSGMLTVQDLNTLSDATLKDNAEIISDPFSILNRIYGVGFNWKDSGKKSYGVLAQMLEAILPELVSVNHNGKKTVNYIPIIAFLIEAVKQQQQDIEALKKDK